MKQSQAERVADAETIVRACQERWAAAFAQMDSAELVLLYARDAIFSGLARELFQGREGVRAYFDRLFPAQSAKVEFSDVVVTSPSAAVIALAASATFTIGTNEPLRVRLTQTLVLTDGRWEILSHHASRRSV